MPSEKSSYSTVVRHDWLSFGRILQSGDGLQPVIDRNSIEGPHATLVVAL